MAVVTINLVAKQASSPFEFKASVSTESSGYDFYTESARSISPDGTKRRAASPLDLRRSPATMRGGSAKIFGGSSPVEG